MSTELTSSFSAAVTGIKTDVLAMLGTAVPAALSIAGIGIAVRIALGLFRSIAR